MRMKRTSVVLNEELLKQAMKVTGKETYAAVIDHALQELVRVGRLERGIQALRDTPNVFLPGYLEEIRPNSWAAIEKRKAASERRAPRKATSRARRSR
jgi:Arc/MetJ family transcription regulator